MRKFLISDLYDHALYTAGSLRRDIETTLAAEGFEKILLQEKNKFWGGLQVLKAALKIPRNSTVFFHFPVRSALKSFLLTLLKGRGTRTTAYIHDFEGLRDQDPSLLQAELESLQPFDAIIAQNGVMQEWLMKYSLKAKVVSLGFYDYLAEPNTAFRRKEPLIAFAGNLRKASFISQLGHLTDTRFNLYGEVETKIDLPNCTYMGVADPYQLPQSMKGSFGLVWDGTGILTCSGGAGEYLRMNTSHKLSLYIMAGLPIIIWKEAAMAQLVKEYRIGITVSSLQELGPAIAQLSVADYQQMQQNLFALGRDLSQGSFLKKALGSIS